MAGNTTTNWESLFVSSTDKYSGYVQTLEDAMKLIREYELATTTKFSCFKADKMFGLGEEVSTQPRTQGPV